MKAVFRDFFVSNCKATRVLAYVQSYVARSFNACAVLMEYVV